jgi:hypothetical protein
MRFAVRIYVQYYNILGWLRDWVCQIGFPRSCQITFRVTAAPKDGSNSAIDVISLWYAHRPTKGGSGNWFVSEVIAVLSMALEYCIGIKIWRAYTKFYHKKIKKEATSGSHVHKEEKLCVELWIKLRLVSNGMRLLWKQKNCLLNKRRGRLCWENLSR